MTEQELIEKLLSIAESEVGYIEKASNKNLDNKTANPGSANYTKYGRDMHNIYPAVMDFPAAWCDCFVDWCFYKCFGTANAKGMLRGDFNDYTVGSAQLYKNKNAYYKSNPLKGDQIFFNNGTRICHTGLVYNVDSKYVYTYEGNTSGGNDVVVSNGGCVAKKKYLLTNSKIDGYGRPNYAAYATTSSSTTSPPVSSPSSNNTPQKVLREIIDISHWNTIDLSKTASKYKDVIIRIGYRAKATGILTLDQKFLSHSQAAIANGFNYGFYFTDQSINEAEAVQQADWCIGLIKPLNVSFPIFIDSEYSSDKHDGRADNITKDQRTKNIIAFCEKIKAAGYTPGVYASDNWFKTMLNYNQISKYVIWCARYSSEPPTIAHYDIWQKGSSIIPGSSSPIDVNNLYVDYPKILKSTSTSPTPEESQKSFCKVSASSLNVRNLPSTKGQAIKIIHNGDGVNVYEMKGNWCKIDNVAEQWCSYSYLVPTKGKIYNCSSLNCRTSPTDGKVQFVLKKDMQVNILNQDVVSGWYFIEYKNKTGYISNKYVAL